LAISTPAENRHSPGPLRLPILPHLAAWSRPGPEESRKGPISGDHALAWSAWQAYLAQRDYPRPLGELLPSRTPPLAWALAEIPGIEDLDAVRSRLTAIGCPPRGRRAERLVDQWLGQVEGSRRDCGRVLEALAWCHALPRVCQSLAPDAWWQLLQGLLVLAGEAAAAGLAEEPLLNQLLAGELRLTLACLLPEIEACHKLAGPAKESLSAGLLDLLDGEGTPHGKYLGLLRPLLACWTRVLALGSQIVERTSVRSGRNEFRPTLPWSDAAQVQYQWLVQSTLRLSRCDGTHVFSTRPTTGRSRAAAGDADLLQAALQLGGNQQDRAIAGRCFTPLASKVVGTRRVPQTADGTRRVPATRRGKPRKAPVLPAPAAHGEWAAVSILRSGWSAADPRLVAVYHDESVRIEIGCRKEVFWSGQWGLEVVEDGQPLRPTGPWEEVCWESADGVDYLELEIDLGSGVRVQRHLALAGKDNFVFLADAILGSRPARLEYRGWLRLAAGMSLVPAESSREGFVEGRGKKVPAHGESAKFARSERLQKKALVLPLALPEWRIDTRPGTLAAVEDRMELSQSATGSALFAPLFVDLDRRRIARPCTWRQLTVGENLAIQSPDVAVGYRVMVGRQQWLIYRSLAPAANRSLLGHNLVSGMLLARFDRQGEVESLVEIE
jgi:hypothetical protein